MPFGRRDKELRASFIEKRTRPAAGPRIQQSRKYREFIVRP
jgi:hypothetical protein